MKHCELLVYYPDRHGWMEKVDLLEFPWGELERKNQSSSHDIILDPLNLDYDVSINLNRSQSTYFLILKINMKRKLMRSFIEIISPPAMLVVVSWVKFPCLFIFKTNQDELPNPSSRGSKA